MVDFGGPLAPLLPALGRRAETSGFLGFARLLAALVRVLGTSRELVALISVQRLAARHRIAQPGQPQRVPVEQRIHREARPVEPALLAKMSLTLAHRGPDGEGMDLQVSVGMARQYLWVTPESVGETQPLMGPSGELLVFDGRIDNREELLQGLEIRAVQARRVSDAALVLSAYRKYGESLPEQLSGDFAFAIYDPRRQLLLLARDVDAVDHPIRGPGEDQFLCQARS